MGWHRQYAHVHGVDHSFMKNPASLRVFDLESIRLETALEDGRKASVPEERARAGFGSQGRARPGESHHDLRMGESHGDDRTSL